MISRNAEKLSAAMTDAQKELFSRYTDCVRAAGKHFFIKLPQFVVVYCPQPFHSAAHISLP